MTRKTKIAVLAGVTMAGTGLVTLLLWTGTGIRYSWETREVPVQTLEWTDRDRPSERHPGAGGELALENVEVDACATELTALRVGLDPDVAERWLAARLAQGQAELLAGPVQRVPTAAESATIGERTEAAIPAGAVIEAVDCEEWPCMVITTHANRPPDALAEPAQRAVAISWGGHVVSRQDGRQTYGGTVTTALFPGVPGADKDLFRRLDFRVEHYRARATEAPAPELMRPPLPAGVADHPCGPNHAALAWLSSGSDQALGWLQSQHSYSEEVAVFMGGKISSAPSDLAPEYREPAVQRAGQHLATRSGLELVDVDCTEHPCMIALGGRMRSDSDIGSEFGALRQTAHRALHDLGYTSTEISLMPGSDADGALALWVLLHPKGEVVDDERASTRRDGTGWPMSERVFSPK